jgi:hypothetical protein
MADAEERRELLKYSARCIVRSRDNLLSWKRGEIIAKFDPQKQVFAQPDLYPAAHREYDLPLIPCDKACDLRNRLRKPLWAGVDGTASICAITHVRADLVELRECGQTKEYPEEIPRRD